MNKMFNQLLIFRCNEEQSVLCRAVLVWNEGEEFITKPVFHQAPRKHMTRLMNVNSIWIKQSQQGNQYNVEDIRLISV